MQAKAPENGMPGGCLELAEDSINAIICRDFKRRTFVTLARPRLRFQARRRASAATPALARRALRPRCLSADESKCFACA